MEAKLASDSEYFLDGEKIPFSDAYGLLSTNENALEILERTKRKLIINDVALGLNAGYVGIRLLTGFDFVERPLTIAHIVLIPILMYRHQLVKNRGRWAAIHVYNRERSIGYFNFGLTPSGIGLNYTF